MRWVLLKSSPVISPWLQSTSQQLTLALPTGCIHEGQVKPEQCQTPQHH